MNYFISDLHFGHVGIMKMERKEFDSIEEHDNHIIEQINKTVKVTDTLYILGDIGDVSKVRFLNGRKILITGNHDSRTRKEYLGYFSEVYDEWLPYNKRIILSHYPRQVEENELNIHGHLHGAILDSNQHVNVSCAVINYAPISDKDLTRYLQKIPSKNNTQFLHEWYANLYKFTDLERTDVVFDENGLIKLEESLEKRQALQEENRKRREELKENQ